MSISGYRSALKWHWEEKKVDWPAEFNKEVARFTSGFKRVKNKRRQDGEEEADEGKQPMQFAGYEWLAKKCVRCWTDFSQGVFSWVFLVLCWNLISRAENVGKLMFEHIGWQDDSLAIRLFKCKHDQEGKDTKAKHVFANPVKPWICPILALGVHMFTMGPRRAGAKNLVFGNESAMGRFSRWLREIMRIFKSTLRAMGINIRMVGTHSFRKGTATYLTGMVDGPTGIAVRFFVLVALKIV